MKRSVILSLFAVALTAFCATTAQATVNVQLNLFYTDPAFAGDPNMGGPVGGTWQLLVQSDRTNGIAGIVFVVDGITGVTGINTGDVTPNPDVWTATDSTFNFGPAAPLDPNDSSVEIVAGDDLAGPLILFVGTGPNTPGNVAVDDLRNSFWNNSALIASGGFGLTRPTIVSVTANEFDSDPNGIEFASIGVLSTRGDAAEVKGIEVAGSGLLLGDANRDGNVTIGDFIILSHNFPKAPGSLTWDQADFDSDNNVAITDYILLSANFPLTPAVPVPISAMAVPEPSTIVMFCFAGLAVVSRRRRTL